MKKLNLSVFRRGSNSGPLILERLLDLYKHNYVQADTDILSWTDGWATLLQYALYKSGPDVSEIGSTWVGDLARMNVLRPFSTREVHDLEGKNQFFQSMWLTDGLDQTCYSIPWSGDVRVLFYRRDMFQQAGINENLAFQDLTRFEETLAQLKESGVESPLAMPSRDSRMGLHSLASWVWAAGGDFVSNDALQITVDDERTIAGASKFFRLGRYFGSAALETGYRSDDSFLRGEAAIVISGSWLLASSMMKPEVHENLGVARLPAVPFVGGSHLSIWTYCRAPELALKLIHALLSEENSAALYPLIGLPIREAHWNKPPFDAWPYPIFLESFKAGRSFSSSRLWGLVEKRLTETLRGMWDEVLSSEENIDEIVDTTFKRLAKRLRLTIERE